MKCEVCNIDTIIFERQSDTGMSERYSECPKCHNQILLAIFDTVNPTEHEYEFNLIITLPSKISMAQLKVLREYCDELKDVGVVKAKMLLEERDELVLGPFWPKYKTDEVWEKIKNTGLSVAYK